MTRQPPPLPSAPPSAPPSLLHVEPSLLALEALDAARGRRRMQAGISASSLGPPRFALHYEELQSSAAAALGGLLGALGVGGGFDPRLLERRRAPRVHRACTMHHAPRTTHHVPRSTHHAPRTMHHAPCTTLHAPCTRLLARSLLVKGAAEALSSLLLNYDEVSGKVVTGK